MTRQRMGGLSRERQFNDKLHVNARPAGTAAVHLALVKLQRPLLRFSPSFICSPSACSFCTPLMIEESISLFVHLLPRLLPRSGKAGDGPSRCCGVSVELELRDDATTGIMLFNAHSFSDDHCCRYITTRLCLA